MEKEKLHSYTVSVDYEICCFSEEEAESEYINGDGTVVHIHDNGEIE